MKNVMKADLYQDMKTVLSNISRKVKIVGNEHTERMKFDWDVYCMALPGVEFQREGYKIWKVSD